MPNYCWNRLAVGGGTDQLAELARNAIGVIEDELSPLIFAKLDPPIDDLRLRDWKWRLENWGTGEEPDVYTFDLTSDHIVYEFTTGWSPPHVWLARVAAAYPELAFVLTYYEPGVMCFGRFQAAGGTCEWVLNEHSGTPFLDFLRAEFPGHEAGWEEPYELNLTMFAD